MTDSESPGLVAALLAKLEWLSRVGANALRTVAVATGVTVVVFWLLVAAPWGGWGAALAVAAALPAAYLWWFARALDAAVTKTRIELGIRELITRTKESVGQVMEARRLRFGIVRAGLRALQSARELRGELDQLGLDIAAWATVANPGALFVAGVSVAASGGIVALASIGIVLQLVL